jgi:hypothetical protein
MTKGEETEFQFTIQRPNFSATSKISKRNNSVFVIATADGPQVTTEVLLTSCEKKNHPLYKNSGRCRVQTKKSCCHWLALFPPMARPLLGAGTRLEKGR